MFWRTLSGFLIPTIVVLTVGFDKIKRKAASGRLMFSGIAGLSFSTRANVFLRLSGLKYLERQSLSGNFVCAVILPPRLPSSSGTRAITPTFNSRQAGNNLSSGD